MPSTRALLKASIGMNRLQLTHCLPSDLSSTSSWSAPAGKRLAGKSLELGADGAELSEEFEGWGSLGEGGVPESGIADSIPGEQSGDPVFSEPQQEELMQVIELTLPLLGREHPV